LIHHLMKTQLFVAGFLVLCLCSCSQSSSSNQQPASEKNKAPSGSQAAAADEKAGTFWELLDKSDLKAVTAPWPPKEGAATLKVEVTANDDEQKFAGTVAYRIAATEQSSGAWQPMPKVREGQDKTMYFEAPITLSNGAAYIQFRVHGAGESPAQPRPIGAFF
jgi:hypothetical protein